ncbi:hypothetical protein [Bacillus pseudomycoides]|uniref:Terminase small subunit n=1 Tax=Bacillus pseudomycoides TaxID=64104 RepID=A0A2C3VHF7_9BACI|nr:hypothetical protein [Bacillus pseudomycoides]PED73000.1 hypothetical protein CON97_06690 [Bacillus pseudomycoides]PEI45051.1 hypothetical protein CN620_03000 [Bacillus pseudomycoides]PEJ79519.1 hypothetical protein CN680_09250 [Bacillus pseudomycoides]PEM20028.1 hypothetical protein CN628_04495 [Bacillus pseudomycoides]PEM69785.1 hypothetical protein CN613_10285 [Bacillus pseudomycoides]
MSNYEVDKTSEDTTRNISLSISEADNQRMHETDVAPYLECLTQKQLIFVYALMESNLNVPAATEKAGLSASYGKNLMKDIRVRRAYTALWNQQSFWKVISHAEALAGLSDIIRYGTDTVINPKTGELVEVPTLNRDKMKAYEMLLKHHKILSDGKLDVNHNTNQTIIVDIDDHLDDEMKAYEMGIHNKELERMRKDISNHVIEVEPE